MNVLDLFSGIGGFSFGLQRAGMRTVAFCEIDQYCRRVLAKHWPGVPCYPDVRELTAERLVADGISVDLVCGGFPCQDISLAGPGFGLAGARSGLWREFARLIRELEPRYVLLENVAALLARGLGEILGELATLGYDAEWHCIPASYVGALHRRDRVWIVAYPNRHTVRDDQQRTPHRWDNVSNRRNSKSPDDGAQGALANSDLDVGREGRVGNAEESARGRNANRGNVCAYVADPNRGRREVDRKPKHAGESSALRDQFDGCRAGGFRRGSHDSNALCERLERRDQAGTAARSTQRPRARNHRTGRDSESDVGRALDGIPRGLDGDPDAEWKEAGAREVLSYLQESVGATALQQATRNLPCLQAQEILFAFLHEYEAGGRLPREFVASAATSEGLLRAMQCNREPTSTPLQRGSLEQFFREHPNALRELSRLVASRGATPWDNPLWESAVPRVMRGIPNRVNRLESLGNAIVPQIAEMIGRAIMVADEKDSV